MDKDSKNLRAHHSDRAGGTYQPNSFFQKVKEITQKDRVYFIDTHTCTLRTYESRPRRSSSSPWRPDRLLEWTSEGFQLLGGEVQETANDWHHFGAPRQLSALEAVENDCFQVLHVHFASLDAAIEPPYFSLGDFLSSVPATRVIFFSLYPSAALRLLVPQQATSCSLQGTTDHCDIRSTLSEVIQFQKAKMHIYGLCAMRPTSDSVETLLEFSSSP